MRVQAAGVREHTHDLGVDVEVTLFTDDGLVVGEVTLWPDPVNGGYGTRSSPPDYWCDGQLIHVLEGDRTALGILAHCAARAVESSQPEEDEV